MFRILLALSIVIFGTMRVAGADSAGSYPVKSIRIIVASSAGGPTDMVARLAAQRLSVRLGQSVIVENKPGANQIIGVNFVAKSAPDGYTLLATGSSPIVTAPYTVKDLPYSANRDLILIENLGTAPTVLYAKGALPVKSLKELIALAKAKPGILSYGSFGNGSAQHFAGEYFSRQVGIKLIHVPYKGAAPQISDLVAGQIDLAMSAGQSDHFVKSGQMKALAVAGDRRLSSLPDVPTFAEAGVAGMEPMTGWWGLFAPAQTPKVILDRLSMELQPFLKSKEFAERVSLQAEPPHLFGDAARAALVEEMAGWRKIAAELPGLTFE